MPNVMVLGSGSFGQGGNPLMTGIRAPIKETLESSTLASFSHVRIHEMGLTRYQICHRPDLGLPSLQSYET